MLVFFFFFSGIPVCVSSHRGGACRGSLSHPSFPHLTLQALAYRQLKVKGSTSCQPPDVVCCDRCITAFDIFPLITQIVFVTRYHNEFCLCVLVRIRNIIDRVCVCSHVLRSGTCLQNYQKTSNKSSQSHHHHRVSHVVAQTRLRMVDQH